METSVRTPLQGVSNIVRFNWQFYAIAAISLLIVASLPHFFGLSSVISNTIVFLIACAVSSSLGISAYIYDWSDLYKLSWLNNLNRGEAETILNIHAGLDETSALLANKFPDCELIVADFYDPKKHTEISIRRARSAYPAFPGTLHISTGCLPFQQCSIDKVFLILSAHEIRNGVKRMGFFCELNRILKPNGQVVVTEHLRDTANFIAYNIGFLHFHSKSTWVRTFESVGLRVSGEVHITPFITSFILEKHGTPP